MTNESIARWLRELANLAWQDDRDFSRARSLRQAADGVARWKRSLMEMYRARGRKGLEEVPGVGFAGARLIEKRLLAGDADRAVKPDGKQQRRAIENQGLLPFPPDRTMAKPVRLLASAPLELAGFLIEPGVELLLDMDRRFRNQHRGALRKEEDGWIIQACYHTESGSDRADLRMDRVILTFTSGHGHGSRMVVTETSGSFRGRRVVRGREDECHRLAESRRLRWERVKTSGALPDSPPPGTYE